MRTFINFTMWLTIALSTVCRGQQVLGFHEAQSEARADWIPFEWMDETVWVNPDVSVTITSAPSAVLVWRTTSPPVVRAMDPPGLRITFSEKDRARFADLTTHVTGRRLAVLHEGRLLSAPFVSVPILGGQVVIYGIQNESLVNQIVARLCANQR